ncbi:MAG: GTPase HflX [Eubacteriales bacterium]|nr:GTPase HflX [Eubacteriales bacterium]MDY3332653.1 GTPase HflX [Gallibacter sp.]
MINFDEKNNIIVNEKPRTIIVGVSTGDDITYSMQELERLAEAAGCLVIGEMTQSLEKRNNATYIGKGKVDELKEACSSLDASLVVFNDELNGIQLRNIEDALGIIVIDRTILILDIFAKRATTKEGNLQVELAQLQYRKSRLIGFGNSLSRQAGGIGTRGPGEKKLETDRRHIERRINELKEELAKIEKVSSTKRKRRQKSNIPVVALVGYTNAGKSALMNAIYKKSVEHIDAMESEEFSVFSEDMLFATLSTKNKKITLRDKREFLLIDTVGFVNKLPHDLVKAFRSTLDEIHYADLLLHVVDASFENNDYQIEVTEDVLRKLDVNDKDKILVYNKVDIINQEEVEIISSEGIIFTSAVNDINIDKLLEKIVDRIFKQGRHAKLAIPYDRGDLVSLACDKGQNIVLEYSDEATIVEGDFDEIVYGKLRSYDTL